MKTLPPLLLFILLAFSPHRAHAQFLGFGKDEIKTEEEKPKINSTPNTASSRLLSYEYPENGVILGQGWDAFAERGTSMSCVQVVPHPIEYSSYRSDVEQVISSLEVKKKRSASGSFSMGGFGSGNVSSSREQRINSDHQNFMFTFEATTGSTFAVAPGMITDEPGFSELETSVISTSAGSELAEQIYARKAKAGLRNTGGRIELTQQAADLLESNNLDDFIRKCGNGFVSAIHRGTKASVVLTHKYQNVYDKRSMSAKISASGFGGSASGSYSAEKSKNTENVSLSYQVYQEGGMPVETKAMNVNQVLSEFNVNEILPSQEMLVANPNAYAVTVTPYTFINDDRKKWASYSALQPANLFTFHDYYIVLSDLYDMIGAIFEQAVYQGGTASNDGAFDETLLEAYGGITHLMNLRDQIHTDLRFLEGMIEACYENRKLCTYQNAIINAKENILTPLVSEIESQVQKAEFEKLEKSKDLTQMRIAVGLGDLDGTGLFVENVLNKDEKLKREKIAREWFKLKQIENYMVENEVTQDGEKVNVYSIDYLFYAKFYKYLIATPLPKSAYSGTKYSDLINQKKPIFVAKIKSEKEKWVPVANDQLRRMIYIHRLKPWNEYFCEEVKTAPLCYSDVTLFDLMEYGAPQLDEIHMNVKEIPRCPFNKKIPSTSKKCHRPIVETRYPGWEK